MNPKLSTFFCSFRFRLIASVILIECVILSIVVWDNLTAVQNIHFQHLQQDTKELARQLSNTAANYMVQVDYAGLEEQFEKTMQQTALSYLLVFDTHERVVVKLGNAPETSSLSADSKPRIVDDKRYDRKEAIKIANLDLGIIWIGVSITPVQLAINKSIKRNIIAAFIGILLTIAVTIIIFIGLTRRLTQLGNAAKEVGRGNYNVHVPTDNNDEIGTTAQAFNLMIDQVAAQQKRLMAQTQRNDLILKNTLDGFWIVNSNGRIVDVNDAYCKMLGYTRQELLNMKISDVEATEGEIEIQERTSLIQKIGHDRFETCHRRKDGSLIELDASVSAIILNNETILVAFFRDITERNQVENELAQYRSQLEELVQQRTKELSQINTELESYSYSIAHDLRAPLRSIAGFTQAVLVDAEDKLSQNDRDNMLRAVNAAKRMARLIDDILHLSRVSRSSLKHNTTNLSDIAKRFIEQCEETQHQQGRKLIWKIEEDLKGTGDPHLIAIALQNLLGNAWKYTSKAPFARIEFGSKQINNETVYYVKDNGVGFDMKYADKLFGVFQRLHGTKEFDGTGIGLATVHRIIQRHGGRIWAEAKVDEGATFYFTLHDSPEKQNTISQHTVAQHNA